MTETVSQNQSPETTYDDLTFERFDEEGSGIAPLADGRFMVEIGEFTPYGKEFQEPVQRYDLALAVDFIKKEPEISAWYGYEHIPAEEGGLDRVIIPNPEQLNARKNSLPAEIGVNQGTFTVQEGAILSAVDYLTMLGHKEIPVATEADEHAHDLCAHTGGFAVISAEIFDFLSATASDTLKGGEDYFSEKKKGEVTGMIDQVSGALTRDPSTFHDTYISLRYSLRIPTDEMRALIASLQASQRRTVDALRDYVRAQ